MKMSKSLIGWRLHMESGKYSSATIEGYMGAIGRIIDFLGDPDAGDVAVWDLEGYLAHLRDAGVSEATRQYYWKVIKSYFSWASKRKGLGIDRPDTELEMPAVPEPEIQPYTLAEIRRLLKACDKTAEAETDKRESWRYARPTADRDKLLILMLLDTGLRVSELCRIQMKDINLENQSVLVRPFETGKKSRSRTVFLGVETMDHLWKIVAEESDPESYLFVSSQSKRIPLNRNAVDHLLKRLGKKAGVKNCGAHRFRHTFAVQYLRNGGDIFTLKRLIGHRSFYMVQRYLQLSDADAKTAHRKASPVDNWM